MRRPHPAALRQQRRLLSLRKSQIRLLAPVLTVVPTKDVYTGSRRPRSSRSISAMLIALCQALLLVLDLACLLPNSWNETLRLDHTGVTGSTLRQASHVRQSSLDRTISPDMRTLSTISASKRSDARFARKRKHSLAAMRSPDICELCIPMWTSLESIVDEAEPVIERKFRIVVTAWHSSDSLTRFALYCHTPTHGQSRWLV